MVAAGDRDDQPQVRQHQPTGRFEVFSVAVPASELLLLLKASMIYCCVAAPLLAWLQHRNHRAAAVQLGVLLFGFTLATNLVGEFAIGRMRRRLGGMA